MKEIEVSELYLAPQGEGPWLGRSSLFLRLRRCNLACSWCDTKQTWQPGFPGYEEYTTIQPEFLANEMMRVATANGRPPPNALVITGGEPLLWQRLLPEVIDRYVDLGGKTHVEVETNGTISPTDAMLDRCHFNVSPKLQSAGNEHVAPARLWNEEATRLYLMGHSSIFKLVVGESDELMVQLYLSWLRKVADQLKESWADVADRVYLMPCAQTQTELLERQPNTIALAQELGVNVTTRMHILAYGAERRR